MLDPRLHGPCAPLSGDETTQSQERPAGQDAGHVAPSSEQLGGKPSHRLCGSLETPGTSTGRGDIASVMTWDPCGHTQPCRKGPVLGLGLPWPSSWFLILCTRALHLCVLGAPRIG